MQTQKELRENDLFLEGWIIAVRMPSLTLFRQELYTVFSRR